VTRELRGKNAVTVQGLARHLREDLAHLPGETTRQKEGILVVIVHLLDAMANATGPEVHEDEVTAREVLNDGIVHLMKHTSNASHLENKIMERLKIIGLDYLSEAQGTKDIGNLMELIQMETGTGKEIWVGETTLNSAFRSAFVTDSDLAG
jgi:hypothetical protein